MTLSNDLKRANHPIENSLEGELLQITEDGTLWVRDLSTLREPIACLFVRSSRYRPRFQAGDRVLFVPHATNEKRGYVLGRIESYEPHLDNFEEDKEEQERNDITAIEDRYLHLKATKGLVIECGTGSIVITEDGKIEIKGKDLLSRARGMNKIKGAAVNIN